jgi:hypothetical protein
MAFHQGRDYTTIIINSLPLTIPLINDNTSSISTNEPSEYFYIGALIYSSSPFLQNFRSWKK